MTLLALASCSSACRSSGTSDRAGALTDAASTVPAVDAAVGAAADRANPAAAPIASGDAGAAPTVAPVDGAGAGAHVGREREGSSPSMGQRRLVLERPIDLGPAIPVLATPRAVVFRQSASDLVGVRVSGSAAGVAARAAAARRDGEGSVALRWGAPVVTSRGQSYWIARGRLLRRAFDWSKLTSEGDVETLASDALDGTRVSAASSDGAVDLVAYVARASGPHDERHARLWSTGSGVMDLSESGAGASSVALAGGSAHWVAVWLDARAAMSPVHARAVDFGDGPPRLGADVVVFVGPSPEGHTEVNALAWPEGLSAFIPFARDTTAFGLALVTVSATPHLDAKVAWMPYPNGIEPAPVDSAVVCGAPSVAYVRPRAAEVDAPAVLAIGRVVNDGIEEETRAAEGFEFFTVSLAAREGGGAWLAWVANGRTWLRGIACLKRCRAQTRGGCSRSCMPSRATVST